MRASIRTKLIIVSLLLLAIPSLVIGVIGYTSAKQSLDDLGVVGLQNDVRLIIKLIDTLDRQVKRGAISLATAQELVKIEMLGEKDAEGKRPIDKSVNIGEHGYYFVMNSEGLLLAHPSLEGENLWNTEDPNGVKVGKVIVEAALKSNGISYYQWPIPGNPDKIAPKVTYAEQDDHWGWVVAASTYEMDFNSNANNILHAVLITLGIALLVGVIVIIIFSRHISIPIRNIANHVHKIANGDLSMDMISVKNKDEIGQLAVDVNTMADNLKRMISKVSEAAGRVAADSLELSANTDQTSQATEQIAKAIGEVAMGAERQLSSMQDASDGVNEIATGVETIAVSVDTVKKSSEQASETAKNGNQAVQKAVDQIGLINRKTEETADVLNLLGEKSNEIENIITMITTIAEQTNLLALNASIEAARAGEHGKGFAVVADEVRKLAEESGSAASKIRSLISDIQENMKHAIDAMGEGRTAVKGGTTLVQQAGDYFEKITDAVIHVVSQMEEVNEAVQKVSSGATQLVSRIDDVSEISEKSANYTQSVAAISEEQTASVLEIADSVNTLSKVAEDLHDSVKMFRI